jgi:nucleoid-associated protein YgaU
MPADESEKRSIPSPRRATALAVVLLATLGAAPLRAQDVAEAARQARERKASQQNSQHHVYTDEDLKHAKILTPEDASRAQISKNLPAPPAKQQEVEAEKIQDAPETPSLGEVARRYRAEKEARQSAEQTAKQTQPSRYPLELPKVSLGAPTASVGPLRGSLREDEVPSARRPLPSAAPGNTGLRVSPFFPRHAAISGNSPAIPSLASMGANLQRKQVQPGDSWWKLAHRYLGDGARWVELLRVNPGLSRDPRKLPSGIVVFVPQMQQARAAPPGQGITIRKGDTMWSLAREQLGCGAAWPQLAAANPEITRFNQLQIGKKIRLPERQGNACPAGRTMLARK